MTDKQREKQLKKLFDICANSQCSMCCVEQLCPIYRKQKRLLQELQWEDGEPKTKKGLEENE